MTDEPTFYPICAHKVTNALYYFRGGVLFENIVTGKQGEVPEDSAKKIFVMLPAISQCVHDFPEVEGLLKMGFKVK
jgi:hypothetical protein